MNKQDFIDITKTIFLAGKEAPEEGENLLEFMSKNKEWNKIYDSLAQFQSKPNDIENTVANARKWIREKCTSQTLGICAEDIFELDNIAVDMVEYCKYISLPKKEDKEPTIDEAKIVEIENCFKCILPSKKLKQLADWIDIVDEERGSDGNEVQEDLRVTAEYLDKLKKLIAALRLTIKSY